MKKLLNLLNAILVLGAVFSLYTCNEEQQDKPVINQLSPATGKEGDVIVISGSFLGSTKKINFGTVEAIPVDPQGGQVTTQVPPNAPLGNVSVTVETEAGKSNEAVFFVIPPIPEIISLTPQKGSSGMSVTMSGKYFITAKEVSFGAQKIIAFDSKTDTDLIFKVPDGIPLGAIDISVTTDGGTSENASFTIVGKPSITEFSPLAGPTGTHVFITGLNFDEASDVFFADTKATFTVENSTLIDAVVPAGAATGKVKIVTPGGEALSVLDYTVKGAPTISSFSPASGAVGIEVTINGTNFNAPGTLVKFGGILATTLNSVSDTQIKVKVPSGAASGKIRVETAAGGANSATNFTVTGAPTITSFTPTTGATGTSVTINGANYINVSSVKFNGTAVALADLTVNSATKITAKVPSGSSDGVITVTTPSGTATSASNFDVIGLPTVTSFNPTSGIVGTSVVITGTTFTQVSAVKFNGVAATTYTVNSTTQITATVPAGATTGKISVTNVGGTGSSAGNFTVIQPPFISSITPTSGVTGTTLTINGTNLSFTSANGKVKFGSTEVSSVTSNSGTVIKVLIPTSLNAGAVNVSVVTPGGTSNTKTFTVTLPVPAPVISSIIPTQSYKGFPLMLRGSNLKNATSVKIGTSAATIATNYDASVMVYLPASISNGSYDVTLINAGGTSNKITLTIITAPADVGAPPSANFVSPPPANFVNAVSNFWTFEGTAEGIAIDGSNPTVDCPLTSFSDDTFCGRSTFTKDGSGNVTANFFEFTRTNPDTGEFEHYYGQWSSTVPDPCVQRLSLISAIDGHYKNMIVDVSFFDLYGTGTCH
jgi:hypothetical protein